MHSTHEDIAVIGLSCVFPGAKNAEAFWNNILEGQGFVQDAPDEWAHPYYDPESEKVYRIYTRRVGLLGNAAEFDPVKYGTVPNAIEASEPDHFIALKEATEALRDSGYIKRDFDRSKTGVILGRGATPNRSGANGTMSGLALDQFIDVIEKLMPDVDDDTLEQLRDELESSLFRFTPESGPGLVSNVAAGRIANRLDLMGPSYMIDAACASSLIAVDLAVRELRDGRSDMMLAGGVQASMPPQVYMMFCKLNALSRTEVRPFDARANGTLLGEGSGFLVLKRLSDAERDQDRIYALIKGLGVASDGKALGLLAPRLEGECLAVERAYAQTGVDPLSIQLVEAHGTGIPLGDQTEIQAMKKVFGEKRDRLPRIALGSVKSMIGHCIPAAGMASLIKTILALHNKMLPPTLCEEVSPDLTLGESPFYVINEARPWINGRRGEPRRAAVNAFGFGGINTHAILEEYCGNWARAERSTRWTTELVVLAVQSRDTMFSRIDEMSQFLQHNPDTLLSDVAYTASSDVSGPCRLAIMAHGIEDLVEKLQKSRAKIEKAKRSRWKTRDGVYYCVDASAEQVRKLAFLFPGQGSQYLRMLGDLYAHFSEVQYWFDISDASYIGLWDTLPSEYVFPPPTCITDQEREELQREYFTIDVSMEAVFTAGMALCDLLSSFGLDPDAIVGHSTGEYTAMAAAGAFDVTHRDQQIEVKRNLNNLHRGFNADANVPQGSLLTVGAIDPATFDSGMSKFEDRLHLAMDNCQHQRIVFGQLDEIEKASKLFRDAGGVCSVLPYGYASHTTLFESMRKTLTQYYASMPIRAPQRTLYSCATCQPFPIDADGTRATAVQQWVTTVRFRETIESMHADGIYDFVEVGPGNVLTQFVEDILRKKDHVAIATNERSRPGLEQLQRVLAQFFVRGRELDFSPLYRHRKVTPVEYGATESGSKVSPTQQVLDLSMPKFSLSDDFVRNFRETLDGRKQPSAEVAGSPPVPQPMNNRHAQTALVEDQQQLMREFLAQQSRMATQVFTRGGRSESPDSKTKSV